MAEKDTKKDAPKETNKVSELKKKGLSRKTWVIISMIAFILLVTLINSPPTSLTLWGSADRIDPRDVGVIHLTTNYPDPEQWIVTEPDEYVDFQTVHNVDLEFAHNGIPVRRIFNAGGSENLAAGIEVGPRTNLTYRICGGTVQTTDLYYVKYRGKSPPRGWYKAALENQ